MNLKDKKANLFLFLQVITVTRGFCCCCCHFYFFASKLSFLLSGNLCKIDEYVLDVFILWSYLSSICLPACHLPNHLHSFNSFNILGLCRDKPTWCSQSRHNEGTVHGFWGSWAWFVMLESMFDRLYHFPFISSFKRMHSVVLWGTLSFFNLITTNPQLLWRKRESDFIH